MSGGLGFDAKQPGVRGPILQIPLCAQVIQGVG
jgi:hypothetical protein